MDDNKRQRKKPNGRSKAAVARRRAAVAAAYLKGRVQADIADELGLHVNTVLQDLEAIRQRWRARGDGDGDRDDLLGRELERIAVLERVYWAAWDLSQRPREVTSTEKTTDGEDSRLKAAVRRETREGNPTFLVGVRWCIKRRCKILGLDAPVKTALTTPDGSQPAGSDPPFDLTLLSDAQLEALADIRATLDAGRQDPGVVSS